MHERSETVHINYSFDEIRFKMSQVLLGESPDFEWLGRGVKLDFKMMKKNMEFNKISMYFYARLKETN